MHFADACAALWTEGELVHVEDLVLRDAMMDARTPTPATNRAMRVLRARRLVERRGGEWALSSAGINELRDRRRAVSSGTSGPDTAERHPLVYSADWDEDDGLERWLEVVTATKRLPALLGAALAHDSWCDIRPLHRDGCLGPLLVAALLRARSKTRHHLAAINVGLRAGSYRRRRDHTLAQRLGGFLDGVAASAEVGHKELDRLHLAREVLAPKLKGRRSTSHLPELIELLMARPVVSVALAAKELRVSSQAAQALIRELGSLREVTGRGRYRAWAV
jgi:hypothetical protein